MSNKSAKDIAFDRERTAYRKELNHYKDLIKKKDEEIYQLKVLLDGSGTIAAQKDEYIEHLLELTEMDLDDLKLLIASEKKKQELGEHLRAIDSVFGQSELRKLMYGFDIAER